MFCCARPAVLLWFDAMPPSIATPPFCVLLVSAALASCKLGGGVKSILGKGGGRDRTPGGESGETQVLAGTIRLVRPGLGFVLIQSSGGAPPPGSELDVHRGGTDRPVAALRVSPETKTGFVVADILSGEPREGDVVFWSLPTAPPPDQRAGGAAPPPPLPPLPDLPPGSATGPGRFEPVPPLDPEAELEQEIRGRGGNVGVPEQG